MQSQITLNRSPRTRALPILTLAVFAIISLAGCLAAETTDTGAPQSGGHLQHHDHIVLGPDDIEYQDGPASLPPGAQFALLQGDPAKENFIALRLSFPPHYEIPPHWHEAVEHVTVLEGTFYIGKGHQIDRDNADELTAGSYSVVPNEEPHYAFTKEEGVVFQLHSIGPWGITYVDPADDPRGE